MKALNKVYYYLYRIFISPYKAARNYKLLSKNTYNISESLLQNILQYAANNITYYHRNIPGFIKSKEIALSRFPIIDRSTIQSNSLEFQNKKKIIYKNLNTSGSSGNPLSFKGDPLAGAVDYAHQKWSFVQMGYVDGDRIVCINGYSPSEKNKSKNIFWKRNKLGFNLPFGSVQFSAHLINENSIKYYINKLEEINTRFIRGYPSAIYELAFLIKKNKIKLNLDLKAIQLTSENIFDYQVELINQIFNAPVFRQYGHTECSTFAYSEANLSSYKFSPLYGYVEIIKDDGDEAQVGEIGEIVVTGYHNFVQPFIRYRTGDYARFSGVENEIVTISELLGREQDYLLSFTGERIPLTSIVAGQHLIINNYIKRWQFIQKKKGHLDIIIEGKESELDNTGAIEQLKGIFEKYVSMNIKYIENIKLQKNGKLKFFISEC